MTRMFLGFLFSALFLSLPALSSNSPIPLDGEWRLELDPGQVGEKEGWHGKTLPGKIHLPGSLDEGGFGDEVKEFSTWHLSRLRAYTGQAWYQRDIEIPSHWQGRRISLFLERCHWETSVWVDGFFCGSQESLCVAHVHKLPANLAPGKHVLTIRVDNTIRHDIGNWSHAITEETQSNWNGIVGRIELQDTDPVSIKSIQVYPNVENRSARTRVIVSNHSGKPCKVELNLALRLDSPDPSPPLASMTASLVAETTETVHEMILKMGDAFALWSEFAQPIYCVDAILSTLSDEVAWSDVKTARFGMRSFKATPDGFTVNGQPTFLRGTLECCIFPLTGYPAMDEKGWERIFSIARSYGLNHMRFHSWCPPEAAFEAADKAGFYLQAELPLWTTNVGQSPKRDAFIQAEMDRILEAYGNHPSFCMLCMGNELGGELSFLEGLVQHGQKTDRRHLYISMTAWNTTPSDDYRVTHKTEKGPVRGLRGPMTDWDYREQITGLGKPTVAHEISQWTIYPNYAEIPKYTGVFRPKNFEIFREDLAKKQRLDQAPLYVRASGALMLLLYKEDIEAALRTPGFGGFQLLDLHDFPGQGTALVGTLDPFWDSKGLIEPERFRQYCGPVVPLLRFSKRVWKSDETLAAQAELYHYGPETLLAAEPAWEIVDDAGKAMASGALPPRDIKPGQLAPLGEINAPLASLPAPSRLTLRVFLKNAPEIRNEWSMWVYPAKVDTSIPEGIRWAENWDKESRAALEQGATVFLSISPSVPLFHAIKANFKPPFWSPIMFPSEQGGMSILCSPSHPMFKSFPTGFHTDWQWWDVMQGSREMILDELPMGFRPSLQVMDSFAFHRNLALAFEARVGKGKLLLSSMDLSSDLENRIAARQLRRSLLDYAASNVFNPTQELRFEDIDALFSAPPVFNMRKKPENLEKAALHVHAGAYPPENTTVSWNAKQDEVLIKKEGFQYEVRGSSYRDAVASAWNDTRLGIFLRCPPGFVGGLYLYFHDWNTQNRAASISFEKRSYGELGGYDGEGFWLRLPVTAEDSKDGSLDFMATTTRGPNAIVREMALIEEE